MSREAPAYLHAVALRSTALQDTYVLLGSQGAGVVAVNHVHAGAGVACECEYVNAVAVQQPKGNA